MLWVCWGSWRGRRELSFWRMMGMNWDRDYEE
jgi:hypothetical protein